MEIRQEERKDHEEVYKMIKEAFATAEHADGNEQELAETLRRSHARVPDLSLVAEDHGEIIGHILFTEAKVGKDTVLALAPLSVKPGYQRQGVGAALVWQGHKIAGELGYSWSLVLGSETYYPKFGYVPAEKVGIQVPEGFPSPNFMAARLREEADPIKGEVVYAREFGL